MPWCSVSWTVSSTARKNRTGVPRWRGGRVVFLVGVAAAFCLGLGYVLQQRTAAVARQENLLSWRLVFELMHKRMWWVGIAAMMVGQLLGGLALDLATVTVVEPLLSANLLFAFAIAAFVSRTGCAGRRSAARCFSVAHWRCSSRSEPPSRPRMRARLALASCWPCA
jgi:hypothetical protein